MKIGIYNNYAEVIFRKLFSVRVPIISTYSEQELETVGVPVNVIDGKKHDSYNEMTLVMITIADMVEKYNNGMPITVVNEKDIIEIYDVVQKHLNAWKFQKITSPNQAQIGVDDDLILMDKFINEVFNINKRNIVDSSELNKNSFVSDFKATLMSPVKVNKSVIDYDKVERISTAPKVKRQSKYDLSSLLN